MRIGIAAFTANGKRLAERLKKDLDTGDREFLVYRENLKAWCRECFEKAQAIIFIGACGIAVRTIAPCLKSKTTDPAVVVIDEGGQYVISLLSGHIGGANEFALHIAEVLKAVPVITTASDVNGKIAVDVFARKNHLHIGSMKAAKEIAAGILRGDRTGVYCTGEIEGPIPPELTLISLDASEGGGDAPEDPNRQQNLKGSSGGIRGLGCEDRFDQLIWISELLPDPEVINALLKSPGGTVLHLIPRSVVLGLGCRRGKPEQEIREAAEQILHEKRVSPKALAAGASIDLKKDEPGIQAVCRGYDIPFYTYTAAELLQVEGEFQSSEFVRKTTGVDNVCERAALRAAGEQARLTRKKYAKNGVTAALAVQRWRVRFGE